MNQLTKDYLTKIGVNPDTLEKLSGEELPEDVTIDGLAGEFRTSQLNLAKNNPDLVKGIRDEIRGTELSKIEHKIKKTFDLSADEMKDKKFEEILDAAKTKITASAGSTSEELQNKILELNNQVKEYEDTILPAERNKSKETITKFKRDLAVQKVLSSRQLIVGNEVILPALNNALNDFVVNVNEKNEIEVTTKDGLKPLSSDGTKQLSFEDIIDNQLTTMNVVKKSNGGGDNPPPTGGGDNPPPAPPTGGEGDSKYNLPGMAKATSNAEKLSDIRDFSKD